MIKNLFNLKITENIDKLEKKIKDNYFVDYRIFLEKKILSEITEDDICYRCHTELSPLTFIESDFAKLPCWECSSKKKSDRQLLTEGILRNIKEYYYNKILGDRYLQLFIVDDIYFRNTLPHDYGTFKKLINSLEPPSRNDVWFLDWLPGFPKIISIDNIAGLKIVNMNEKLNIVYEKDYIKIGDYTIKFPEIISYDSKHHSRYNIFNKNGNRRAKRLKIYGDKCIKFFNTEDDNVKSIFKVTKSGEDVSMKSLSREDFVLMKLCIMRHKPFLKLVFDVLQEMLKGTGVYSDSVFLKNTINIDPSKNFNFSLVWNYVSEFVDPKTINVSII